MDALTSLDLSHIPSVDDYLLQTLSTHGSIYLRTLKLQGCLKIGDEGVKTIARAFPGLWDLHLDYTRVSAVGVKDAIKRGLFGLRALGLSHCQGVLGTDVHTLARLIWWEENCVTGDGGTRGSQLSTLNGGSSLRGATIGGLPVSPVSVVTAVQNASSHGNRLQSLMIQSRQSPFVRASSADIAPSPRFSGVLKGKAKVLGNASGWNETDENRPHSVIGALRGGVSMGRSQSVNGSAGGPVGVRSSVAWRELGVPMRMNSPNQNDGIKLDPTLIEFVTVKNIDRIRELK
ncbi:UNVERIFIED_CONTAM: hypothetical protein HDU68_011726 [Siphonaria sp. JEL0065]|nr:hypothetical protein HDU68_011726 [Siphonaria sp. JEL0065]